MSFEHISDASLNRLLWMTTNLVDLVPHRANAITHLTLSKPLDLSTYRSLSHVRLLEGEWLVPPTVRHVELCGTATLHQDQTYNNISYLTSERLYAHDMKPTTRMEAFGLVDGDRARQVAATDLRLVATSYRATKSHAETQRLSLHFVRLNTPRIISLPPMLVSLSLFVGKNINLEELMKTLPLTVTELELRGQVYEQKCSTPPQLRRLTIISSDLEFVGSCVTLNEGLVYLRGVHKQQYPKSLRTLVYPWALQAEHVASLPPIDLHYHRWGTDPCDTAATLYKLPSP